MSMLSAARACCSRAAPEGGDLDIEPMPLKDALPHADIELRNANASATALPARSFSCAEACEPASVNPNRDHTAAATINNHRCAIMQFCSACDCLPSPVPKQGDTTARATTAITRLP